MVFLCVFFKIWINVYNLHHDERYWDKPWDFMPERFLGEDGHLVKADHPNRRRYVFVSEIVRSTYILLQVDLILDLILNRNLLVTLCRPFSLVHGFNFLPNKGYSFVD